MAGCPAHCLPLMLTSTLNLRAISSMAFSQKPFWPFMKPSMAVFASWDIGVPVASDKAGSWARRSAPSSTTMRESDHFLPGSFAGSFGIDHLLNAIESAFR